MRKKFGSAGAAKFQRRLFRADFKSTSRVTRRAPSRVEGPHPADELDQFPILARTAPPTPGLPSPEHSESGALPADQCPGLEDHQRASPIWPDSLEDHPEVPVPRAELGPILGPFEHRDLVSLRENFQRQFVLRSEQRKRVEQCQPEHLKLDLPSLVRNSAPINPFATPDAISATHRRELRARSPSPARSNSQSRPQGLPCLTRYH